tara:strand:+ start:3838 stop:4587 length:750 start_codon:yes stop_codon:yes gene_type:complete
VNKAQIVANWKMNTTISDSINISTKLSNASLDINNIDITICPPALYLAQVHQILKNSSLKIGAQNIHSEEEGAYTGEISAKMISDYCDTVILGHSERRQIFKESNQDINKKFLLAKKFNLNSIICVGETIQERESGKAKKIVSTQILSALKSTSDFNKLLIAYEPVWAIGTGKAATAKDAQDMCSYIRNVITELNKNNVAENIPILYGGSVNSENIELFTQQKDINGALVGTASLDPDEFIKLIKKTKQ